MLPLSVISTAPLKTKRVYCGFQTVATSNCHVCSQVETLRRPCPLPCVQTNLDISQCNASLKRSVAQSQHGSVLCHSARFFSHTFTSCKKAAKSNLSIYFSQGSYIKQEEKTFWLEQIVFLYFFLFVGKLQNIEFYWMSSIIFDRWELKTETESQQTQCAFPSWIKMTN